MQTLASYTTDLGKYQIAKAKYNFKNWNTVISNHPYSKCTSSTYTSDFQGKNCFGTKSLIH